MTPRLLVSWVAIFCAVTLGCWASLPWLGLGLHRGLTGAAVAGSALLMVLGPPLAVSMAARGRRAAAFALSMVVWSTAQFLWMPAYFPDEIDDARMTALVAIDWASPPPVRVAESRLPISEAMTTPVEPPPAVEAAPDSPNEIVLPYEGQGRSIRIPIVFGHERRELEVDMMLDTGATYTTLTTEMMNLLGVSIDDNAPIIQLNTANGRREARIALIDHLWIGDLRLDALAVSVCDECGGSGTTAGLLGLNVVGGFNTAIDADERYITFQQRTNHVRTLDVRPFVHLRANFIRFHSGLVEATIRLRNLADLPLDGATANVLCHDETWPVELEPAAPQSQSITLLELPRHRPCETYSLELKQASW